MRFLPAALLLLVCGSSGADGWQFSAPLAVTPEPRAGLFHHLDGAGRKHLAVSGSTVATIWEDNRDGSPQIYMSRLRPGAARFDAARQLSDGREAYEPVIAALGEGAFVLAWEQDGQIRVQAWHQSGPGEMLQLGSAPAGHAALAATEDRVYVAWREQTPAGWLLRLARLALGADFAFGLVAQSSVETAPLDTEVQFPTLAVNGDSVCIAWEDRRAGHTRLLASFSADGGRSFAAPQHLNEFFSNRNQYDRGSGVTRVALASFGGDEILAAWMDKRRGGAGYGIYAALGTHGDEIFGPNERVHGPEGDRQPHYNPAVAGNADGDFAVAWDDFRRGDLDIWISTYDDNLEWGEDRAPAVASGPGEQSHPAIELDAEGNLHLVWIERADPFAPTRLFYSFGQRRP